ncbi:uncharacterized protein LOC115748938 [Rhodamnia argentea]|uniref:Uncharacterized protein LOC115748938 n=1 Tax=Rhodamnia argentea TaxID=178133 RepID=A0A8B8Q309_9MYRT|nr:uncharacterized protein LOC115748938 [Rhodamnia argentea]
MPSRRSELFAPPCFKPYAASLDAAAASSSASMDASSFPLIGDYIGMESCVDIEEPPDPGASTDGGDFLRAEPERDRGWRWEPRGKRRREREEKEYPPPIPLLARTGNLHSHMPWVLRRHYTGDGRLILTEEKVRHHEYFRARRANGRLTLQLVPLDGDNPCFPTVADEEEEQEEEEEEEIFNPEAGITTADDLENRVDDDDDYQGKIGDRTGEEEDDCARLASSIAELTVESGGGGGIGGNGAGKCSNYNGISVSPGAPCIFGVPVPALRPVHS